MNSIRKLMNHIKKSYTAYHAVSQSVEELEKDGFKPLEETAEWKIERGEKYYVIRDGSAMIAFDVGQKSGGFRIVASHTDSPCLKVKGNAVIAANGYTKLNVERYGGGLYYSWLDIPLKLAGRAVTYDPQSGKICSKNMVSDYTSVIPSLAIHFQRDANSSFTLNPQIDLQPVVSLDPAFCLEDEDGVIEKDLFLVNAAEPYLAGAAEELLIAPRLDNLTSVFASVEALTNGGGEMGISMIYLADNEEIGSRTKQGAGSDFLRTTMARVAHALGESIDLLLPRSFLVSCDNAHAIHPNHPEKSDTTEPVHLGGGVVIKHHANQNYTTDAFSSAVLKAILQRAKVPYQDFYMRADMPCGGTLGAISSSQVSIRSVDIGLAQLAMHSATETMAAADYNTLVRALAAFFAASIQTKTYNQTRLN